MEIDDILNDFERQSRPKKELSSDINARLVQAMLNERMAPDILPYQTHLMDQVLTQIQHQQQLLLDSYEYGDSNSQAGVISSDFKLLLMIIETNIERVAYLVRLYIRTRLAKIDNFTIYYVNETAGETEGADPSGAPLLSGAERSYMHKHFKILTLLYNTSFLNKLPNFLQLLDDTTGGESMIATPNVDEPVFIRVVCEEPITLALDADDELVLTKNGIYVVKYRLIRLYVQLGDVLLI